MKIQSPSGKTYEWTKTTPPTESDLAALVAFEQRQAPAEPAETNSPQAAVPAVVENRAHVPEPNSVKPTADSMTDWSAEWKKAQTPADGAKLVAKWISEHKGSIADLALIGALPAIGEQYGGPIGRVVFAGIGDTLAQARRVVSGEQPSMQGGEVLGSMIAAAPASKQIKSASGLVTQAVKYGTANAAAKATQDVMDKGETSVGDVASAFNAGAMGAGISAVSDTGKRAEMNITRKADQAPRDKTLATWRSVGGVLDPELANPNVVNRTTTALAGNSQLQKQAIVHNQSITNKIVRDEIGIPLSQEIGDLTFANVRQQMTGPYREVANLSKTAGDNVKKWQEARADARKTWGAYNRDANPATKDAALKLDATADKLETAIEAEINSSISNGRATKSLLADFVGAKKELAKLHVAESAYNEGNGSFSAPTIAAMRARTKLTDGLRVVADMQDAMPQVMSEAQKVSASPVWARTAVYSGAALGGYKAMGVPGAVGALTAVQTVPPMLRSAALSNPYQAFMTTPRYGEMNPDLAASIMRFSTQSLGR